MTSLSYVVVFPLQNKRRTGTEDAAATAGPGTKTPACRSVISQTSCTWQAAPLMSSCCKGCRRSAIQSFAVCDPREYSF